MTLDVGETDGESRRVFGSDGRLMRNTGRTFFARNNVQVNSASYKAFIITYVYFKYRNEFQQ